MKYKWLIPIVAALVVIAAVRSVVFIDETEVVIVTQFGRPVRTLNEKGQAAGLHFKAPYQSTIRIDRRLQIYDPRPSEFLAAEKKNVNLDVFVCWKVLDPQGFLETVNDVAGAESRLHDIVWAELAAEVGRNPLEAIISTKPEPSPADAAPATPEDTDNPSKSVTPTGKTVHRLDDLMRDVSARCAERARTSYGIEIVDVRLKRISLPKEVRDSVFQRMRAERARMARRYRAEGKEEAMKITAAARKQETIILAKANAEAQRIRGDGEATATRIYANAYKQDPEFYELTRTLEAYRKFLDEKTTILLNADSELLKYLTQGAMLNDKKPTEK